VTETGVSNNTNQSNALNTKFRVLVLPPPMAAARSIAATTFVAIVMITGFASRAHAQNAAAETLFSDGERLMKEHKLAEACDAFESSNRIEARAGTLINLGLCREQNGQLASAWSAFKDALTRVKDPKKAQVANQRVAAIEPKLSYVTISVPDESRVDGLALTRNGVALDPGLWNRAIPVDGGSYVIAGRAPGHEEWSTTVQVPNENGKVTVDVPRFKDLAKLIAPTPAAPAGGVLEPVDEPAPAPSMFTTQRKVALGIAGLGVAGLAAGVVFGLQAKGFKDDAYALCPDPATPCADGNRANDLTDKEHTRALIADVSFGVAAVSLISAGALWFLGAPAQHERAVAVTPHAGASSASLDLTVRF
jgi:hypothetical protein